MLLGEYGTGKSRCFKQLFKELSTSAIQSNLYPIAIDLRDLWGLKKSRELITRHFDNLGLDEGLSKAAIRCFNAGRAIFLLDGFDELGSQSWSNDNDKLKTIRAKSLEGSRISSPGNLLASSSRVVSTTSIQALKCFPPLG